ncbi:hypothetical protein CRYUN_Cryun05aG0229400 [Craigia yunnanensis]
MKLRNEGIEPNEFTFVAILSACIRDLELELGFQVHANALMGWYGKFNGGLRFVFKMFDEMLKRDVTSWNTVISSLVKEGMYEKAFELFRVIQGIGSFRADFFTISAILSACEGSNALMKGKEVHVHAIRIGLEGSLSVNNTLIGFYSKCGSAGDVVALFESMPVRDIITWTEMITAYMEFGLVDLAVEVFDKMLEKNCVSYNALMAGFCRNAEGLKAVKLFIEMVEEGLELTDFSLSSIINACALAMDVKTSEQIQGFCVKFGFRSNVFVAALLDMCIRVSNSIISMYAKCWNMNCAIKVFNITPIRDVVSWNALIAGHILHRQGDEALTAWLFLSMRTNYDIEPTSQHYASFVSVLGHWGLLEEAEEMIDKMTLEPKASVWRALLDSCRYISTQPLGNEWQSTYLQ